MISWLNKLQNMKRRHKDTNLAVIELDANREFILSIQYNNTNKGFSSDTDVNSRGTTILKITTKQNYFSIESDIIGGNKTPINVNNQKCKNIQIQLFELQDNILKTACEYLISIKKRKNHTLLFDNSDNKLHLIVRQ